MQRTIQVRTRFGFAIIFGAAVTLALLAVGAYGHGPGRTGAHDGEPPADSTEYLDDILPGQPDEQEGDRGEAEGIPLQITHQGVIKVSGLRFDGDGYFRFALYDLDASTNVWTNDGSEVPGVGMPTNSLTVHVDEGVYSIALGDTEILTMEPIEASVFTEHDNLALRIWFTDGVTTPGPLELSSLKVTSTGYAYQAFSISEQAAEKLVPIGTILDWWRPDASVQPPDGFKICDGTAIDDPASPWYDESDPVYVPNLQDKFVRGVTDPANIGLPGGSATATHAHTIDHAHSATSSGGAHYHVWATREPGGTYEGDKWREGGYGHAFATVRKYDEPFGGYIFGLDPATEPSVTTLYTDLPLPSHNHTHPIPAFGGNSGPASPDNIPPYVGLLKIMRIK